MRHQWIEQHIVDWLRYPRSFHDQRADQLLKLARRRSDCPGGLSVPEVQAAAERLATAGRISRKQAGDCFCIATVTQLDALGGEAKAAWIDDALAGN